MKLTDLLIIFVIFTIPFNFAYTIKQDNVQASILKKVEIDHIIDSATQDGVTSLLSNGVGNTVNINKENAVKSFFNTLCISFNAIDNDLLEKQIAGYIPIIVIIDTDGFYVLASEEYTGSDGKKRIDNVWTPKIPYAYSDSNYVYNFTLDKNVTVYDISANKYYDGIQEDLKVSISSDIIQDNSIFESKRRRTIIDVLQQQMTYYINKHNTVAKYYGITYNFYMPVISDNDWSQTIDDVGILAFIQGIPIGIDGDYYNNFALGGADVVKQRQYFIQLDPTTGIRYYHEDGCSLLSDKSEVYNSPLKCAEEGALPCDICKP